MPQIESPTHVEMRELCKSTELVDVLHPYAFIQGVIFAVAAAPEIPMPEVWLPWAIKTRHQLCDAEQADNLTDLLMKLLQIQLKDMSEEIIHLPVNVAFSDTKKQQLSQWCQGMLLAHRQLEPVWHNAWNKMLLTKQAEVRQLQKDLSHCLYMFTTFADIPLAIEQAQSRGNDKLPNILPKIFLSFPQTLKTYVSLSGRLVDFLPNQFETFAQK